MKTKKRQLHREFAAIYARELRGSNKERLERNLEDLEFYFQPGSIIPLEHEFQRNVLLTRTLRDLTGCGSYVLDKLGFWPSRELLREIECLSPVPKWFAVGLVAAFMPAQSERFALSTTREKLRVCYRSNRSCSSLHGVIRVYDGKFDRNARASRHFKEW